VPAHIIARCLIAANAAAALLLAAQAFGQSQRESGERLIRDQEHRWNIFCKSIHSSAHKFVAEYVASLLSTVADGSGPLQSSYASVGKEASELSGQTLKCYGIEPIARNSGVPFEPDFGALHEVLRTTHEFIESIIAKKHQVLRDHNRSELRKRYDELKSGTGRRYRTRT
jgi:hypothetical protein